MHIKHRGIGRTALMIETLPVEPCIIVVPLRNIGFEINKMVEDSGRKKGTWRIITINRIDDDKQLYGVEDPVFFDHSFFDAIEAGVAMQAVSTARICSERAKWKRETPSARPLRIGSDFRPEIRTPVVFTLRVESAAV